MGILLGGTESAVWAACPGGTCYVDANCSPPTDGTSGDPDCKIQEGIDRAANGETVLVRAGTYEPIEFNGRAITVRRETTEILPRITHNGGAIKVKFTSGDTSVLDGFEVSGGSARGISSTTDSAPTIKNCTIKQNDGDEGGGIQLDDSNARIIDCIIENNEVTFGRGGGIYITNGSAAQITGCTIQGNTAFENGGGIAISNSFPVITNCVISANTANGDLGGGGVWSSPPETSGEGGTSGSFTCEDGCSAGGAVNLTNCLVVGNSATNDIGRGGGLFLGFDDVDGRTEISNCTISGNTATGDGDGIYAFVKCFTLRNSILWDNGPGGSGSEITLDSGARAFLRYDDIEGGLGNIKLIGSLANYCEETNCGTSQILNSNPNFCAAPTDYRLCRVSPCIDAGDNAGIAADIADLNGNSNISEPTPYDLNGDARRVDDLCTSDTRCGSVPIVDMGAYELQVVDVEVRDWKSVVTHGASNTIALTMESEFSESRNGGVTKLRLSFSGPIDPASVSASNVVICGNDVNDQPLDLSGITFTTAVLAGNMIVEINFTPKLPNYARYRVRLIGVEDMDCNVISVNSERIFTALFGDASGDRRVNATDVGWVRTLEGTSPINPGVESQVRCDVDNDDDVDTTDTDLVRDEIPKDARYIADPSCP